MNKFLMAKAGELPSAVKTISALLLAGALITLFYGIYIEPFQLEIAHFSISRSRFGAHMAGKTAVHLSDLHLKKIGNLETKIFSALKTIQPDFIFLTGDYVKWKGDYEPAFEFLSRLSAKYGVYGVLGDYDYGDTRKVCLFCHRPNSGEPPKRHNVRFLRDEAVKIPVDDGYLTICGLHSAASLEFVLKQHPFIKPDTPLLVLAHSPLFFDRINNQAPAVVLAGDTHGGQIPIPAALWGLLGYKKNAEFPELYYERQRKQMYISRGTGTSHLPLRILRPPQLTVFHFQ